MADPRALVYRPEPLGLTETRRAVADRLGSATAPDSIAMTASTSEASAMLATLRCAAGDEVLVPRPSSPLAEPLTGLASVRAVPYRLDPHGAWCLDRRSVE